MNESFSFWKPVIHLKSWPAVWLIGDYGWNAGQQRFDMNPVDSAVAETGHDVTLRQIEFSLSIPICAWCKPGVAGSAVIVSHGICLRHLKQMRLKLEKRRRKAAEISASA